MPVIVDRARNQYVSSVALVATSTGKLHPPMDAVVTYTLALQRSEALTFESLFVAHWWADLLRCAGPHGRVGLHPINDMGVEPG